MDEKLTDKANKTADDLNTMINTLSTGSATPQDADYYVSQYAGGGSTTTTYHRRPMSALWTYIKSKAGSVFAAKSHTHNYAGSGSAGGSANSAVKLDTATAGQCDETGIYQRWQAGGLHSLAGQGCTGQRRFY